MTLLLIVLFYMLGIRIGTYGIFKKLGVDAPWKAFVPVLCSMEWQKITHKPKWWTWMLFIPGVNLFYVASQLTDMSTAFKRHGFWEHFAAVMFAFAYFPWLGFSPNEKFIGPGGVKPGAKPLQRTVVREWADAIVFAVVAATLIRIFVAEAYMIPTPSMEKTLLVGDFLFVSKFHYGARVPNTPLAMPFVHHTIPVLNCKSYVEWIKLPYKTLPGFENVKRNDMVVFNFPAGDTVIDVEGFQSERPYYDVIREAMKELNSDYTTARMAVWNQFAGHIITRPVDKRENYIKRCVALPGDKLELKNGVLYINDSPAYVPENMCMAYYTYLKNPLTQDEIDDLQISGDLKMAGNQDPTEVSGHVRLNLTQKQAEKLLASGNVDSLHKELLNKGEYYGVPGSIFPNNVKYYDWSIDNFGPVYIPKKGQTIPLSDSILPQYERAIRTYEGNELEQKDGKIYINGKEATSYTFKMDYYWMMGDNRHNSQDCRFWGFVPEDHIVGKAWFIWMSWNSNTTGFKKVRWNRLFTSIHGKWAPKDPKYTDPK